MNPAGWKRDTPWRQGSAIPHGVSLSFGLLRPEEGESGLAIVISHDCDLAEDDLDREPFVEVVIGALIDSASPNHTFAKSPNKLHLEIMAGGQPRYLGNL
jgi:hypothetical protein